MFFLLLGPFVLTRFGTLYSMLKTWFRGRNYFSLEISSFKRRYLLGKCTKNTQTQSRNKQLENGLKTSCKSWVSSQTSILFFWIFALFHINKKLVRRINTICSWKGQLFPNDQGILSHLWLPVEATFAFGVTMVSMRAVAELSNWGKTQLSPLEATMGLWKAVVSPELRLWLH